MAALGTTLAAVGGWRYARASAPVNGPIILVSIDALRADRLPAYGYPKGRTPTIDALAADGSVFERAYSHAPETLPAHVALLSGRLPLETGVRGNAGFRVKPDERLLPQMLRERGFATGGIVSAYVLRKDTGLAQGFDFFDGELPAVSPELDLDQVARPGLDSEAVAEHWLDTIGTSRAFLFLHIYEPHALHTPPDRFSTLGPYDGEVAAADEALGRFIQYLKAHQLYDRSTIILVSDHGEGLGDHGEQAHGMFLVEESLHVPLIIKQAGGVGAGQRLKDVVQHIDVVPTILDLARAPIPGSLRGQSLKPLLDGTGSLSARTVYSETLSPRMRFGWSELTALTGDRYRYVKGPADELYDLQRDPHERDNLAADLPAALEPLRLALDRMLSAAPRFRPAEVPAEDEQRRQALGYDGVRLTSAPAPSMQDRRALLEQLQSAEALETEGHWRQAVARMQQILAANPQMADAWRQLGVLAVRADRLELAVDAFRHVVELRPSDAQGYLDVAEALLRARKLDDAHAHAALAASLGKRDVDLCGGAHDLLARIALVRRNPDEARREAALARAVNPSLVTPTFVEARLLYDEVRYDEALLVFGRAITEQTARGGRLMPELHELAADTAVRLGRYRDAEREFLAELQDFPRNTRAAAGLAMLYRTTGRPEEAAQVVNDMTRAVPTSESYALATRLWTALGNRRAASAARAESQRRVADARGIPRAASNTEAVPTKQ